MGLWVPEEIEGGTGGGAVKVVVERGPDVRGGGPIVDGGVVRVEEGG